MGSSLNQKRRPRKPIVIGVVGSRKSNSYLDFLRCLRAFEEVYREGDQVVSGGYPRGGDRFAELISRSKGLTITIHYPDWNRFGKGAGFERNTRIAEDADIIIAVVAKDRTGGTEDTISKAKRLGKKLILV